MNEKVFKSLRSKAVPLLVDNIDTDTITPIGRILEGGAAVLKYAFEPLRYDANGLPRPGCPLNDPAFKDARILIAGDNFACGSSRETAVWAIRGLGFRVVLAPSFGDIFYSNCFKNGILPIPIDRANLVRLAEIAGERRELTVDLEQQLIIAGELDIAFTISAFRREALLGGLDDLDIILSRAGARAAFEVRDRTERPWIYLE